MSLPGITNTDCRYDVSLTNTDFNLLSSVTVTQAVFSVTYPSITNEIVSLDTDPKLTISTSDLTFAGTYTLNLAVYDEYGTTP